MGAHRRRIVRRRIPSSGRRNRDKSDVASSDNHDNDSWESGSVNTVTTEDLTVTQQRPEEEQRGGDELILHRSRQVREMMGRDRGIRDKHFPGDAVGYDGADRRDCGAVDSNENRGIHFTDEIGGNDSNRRQNEDDQQNRRSFRYQQAMEDSRGMIGRPPKLSSSEEATLGTVRQWVTDASLDLAPLLGDVSSIESCPVEEEDRVLARFLRRNDWDLGRTKKQLEENISWRKETGVMASLRQDPWEVAGCKNENSFETLCRTCYPHYTLGTDRMGRPVLLQQYGNFNLSKLKECTSLAGLLRYHAWEQEKNAELLRRSTARRGRVVETYTVIMDFKDMGLSLVNGDFIRLLRELSEFDRKYYPGRGGVTYVINTPPLFGLVWRSIRSFMETTQARIHIFGNENEWKPALAEAIDPAKLPPEYGGTGPTLADIPFLPAVHRALEKRTAIEVEPVAIATAVVRADRRNLPGVGGKAVVEAADRSNADQGAIVSGAMSSILRQFSRDDSGSGSGNDGDRRTRDMLREAWVLRDRTIARDFKRVDFGGQKRTVEGDGVYPQEWEGDVSYNRTTSSLGDVASPMLPPMAIALPPLPVQMSTCSSWTHTVPVSRSSGDHTVSGDGNDESESSTHNPSHERTSDVEWVLDTVPGARLAAGVAGSLAGATLGFTLSTAGYAAGVVEAMVPADTWQGGVNAFEAARFVGRSALGF